MSFFDFSASRARTALNSPEAQLQQAALRIYPPARECPSLVDAALQRPL